MQYRSDLTSPATARFGILLWSGSLLIIAILVVIATWTLRSSRAAFAARANQSAENLAEAFAASIESDIRLVDQALLTAVEQAESLAPEERNQGPRVEAIAATRRSALPPVDILRFTDRDGVVLRAAGPVVDVADRDYFIAARDRPDRLAVSEPLEDRINHREGLIFARARRGTDGRFGGVAYASLSSRYFVEKFNNVNVGSQGAVTLRTDTLQLVARYTPSETSAGAPIGTRTVSEQFRLALARDAVQGTFVSHTAIDHIERINAYRKVAGFPLIVLVGLGTDEFFAAWRSQVTEVVLLCALLSATVLALSGLAHRTHRRHLAVRHEQAAMLDNDLVGMVRLRHRKAVWHNAALSKLFGYEGDSLVGLPSRLLYADDDAYERIGQAYSQIERGGRVRTQVQMRRRNGQLLWIDLSGVRLGDADSLWMMVDITAVKASEIDARYRAVHDPLTGLFNRAGVEEAVAGLHGSTRRSGGMVAICYIDLDGFKAVNDRHGHGAGDLLLAEAARRISACTRAGDIVARMGGDEFVAAIGHVGRPDELQPALERLVSVLSEPFALPGGASAAVSASIGAAWMPPDRCDAACAIARADHAMYAAKHAGKNRCVIDDTEVPDSGRLQAGR